MLLSMRGFFFNEGEAVAASKILPAPAPKAFEVDRQHLIDSVGDALYASKIVSDAQGLDLLGTAGKFYGRNLNFGDIATICAAGASFAQRS